ncbi:MAG: hypothetical protein NVS4B11_16730 [Ktedonobacteraceae bacterium]
MHTLLMVLSVLLLIPGSAVALWLLRRFGGWTWHRDVQVLLLLVPLLSLMIDLVRRRSLCGSDVLHQRTTLGYPAQSPMTIGE